MWKSALLTEVEVAWFLRYFFIAGISFHFQCFLFVLNQAEQVHVIFWQILKKDGKWGYNSVAVWLWIHFLALYKYCYSGGKSVWVVKSGFWNNPYLQNKIITQYKYELFYVCLYVLAWLTADETSPSLWWVRAPSTASLFEQHSNFNDRKNMAQS